MYCWWYFWGFDYNCTLLEAWSVNVKRNVWMQYYREVCLTSSVFIGPHSARVNVNHFKCFLSELYWRVLSCLLNSWCNCIIPVEGRSLCGTWDLYRYPALGSAWLHLFLGLLCQASAESHQTEGIFSFLLWITGLPSTTKYSSKNTKTWKISYSYRLLNHLLGIISKFFLPSNNKRTTGFKFTAVTWRICGLIELLQDKCRK